LNISDSFLKANGKLGDGNGTETGTGTRQLKMNISYVLRVLVSFIPHFFTGNYCFALDLHLAWKFTSTLSVGSIKSFKKGKKKN